MHAKILANYRSLTDDFDVSLLDPQEGKERFDGIFRETDWTGLEKAFFNPRAGWAEAENALRSCVSAALEIGVQYVQDAVSTITFDSEGGARGVKLLSGRELKAGKVILAAGAFTAKLLVDSNPQLKALHAGDRFQAAASVMGLFKVPEAELGKFKSAPIIINSLDHTQGEFGKHMHISDEY